MTNRTRSDAYLKEIGPRPLTEDEHRRYVEICIEEGSLDTGEGIQDHILASLEKKRQPHNSPSPDGKSHPDQEPS